MLTAPLINYLLLFQFLLLSIKSYSCLLKLMMKSKSFNTVSQWSRQCWTMPLRDKWSSALRSVGWSSLQMHTTWSTTCWTAGTLQRSNHKFKKKLLIAKLLPLRKRRSYAPSSPLHHVVLTFACVMTLVTSYTTEWNTR